MPLFFPEDPWFAPCAELLIKWTLSLANILLSPCCSLCGPCPLLQHTLHTLISRHSYWFPFPPLLIARASECNMSMNLSGQSRHGKNLGAAGPCSVAPSGWCMCIRVGMGSCMSLVHALTGWNLGWVELLVCTVFNRFVTWPRLSNLSLQRQKTSHGCLAPGLCLRDDERL